MKKIGLLFSLCGVLLFSGCVSSSLITDEEYSAYRGPAPYSPDPMAHIPVAPDRPMPGGY